MISICTLIGVYKTFPAPPPSLGPHRWLDCCVVDVHQSSCWISKKKHISTGNGVLATLLCVQNNCYASCAAVVRHVMFLIMAKEREKAAPQCSHKRMSPNISVTQSHATASWYKTYIVLTKQDDGSSG